MLPNKKEVPFLQSKTLLMLLAVFLIILLLTFFFGDRGIMEIIKAKRDIQQLNSEVDRLKSEHATLVQEVARLQKNPLALEKRAREKLWLMKKNEKVIVIVKSPKGKKS